MHDSFSTISNIAYVIFGLLLLKYSFFLAAAFITLGIASTGYHWLRTKAWHKFDLVAIIYAFGVLGGHVVAGIPGSVIGGTCAGAGHYFYHSINPKLIIGGFGLIALTAYYSVHGPERTAFVVAVFASAFMLSLTAEKFFDRDRLMYDILHGVWHPVSAYGMYLLALPPN